MKHRATPRRSPPTASSRHASGWHAAAFSSLVVAWAAPGCLARPPSVLETALELARRLDDPDERKRRRQGLAVEYAHAGRGRDALHLAATLDEERQVRDVARALSAAGACGPAITLGRQHPQRGTSLRTALAHCEDPRAVTGELEELGAELTHPWDLLQVARAWSRAGEPAEVPALLAAAAARTEGDPILIAGVAAAALELSELERLDTQLAELLAYADGQTAPDQLLERVRTLGRVARLQARDPRGAGRSLGTLQAMELHLEAVADPAERIAQLTTVARWRLWDGDPGGALRVADLAEGLIDTLPDDEEVRRHPLGELSDLRAELGQPEAAVSLYSRLEPRWQVFAKVHVALVGLIGSEGVKGLMFAGGFALVQPGHPTDEARILAADHAADEGRCAEALAHVGALEQFDGRVPQLRATWRACGPTAPEPWGELLDRLEPQVPRLYSTGLIELHATVGRWVLALGRVAELPNASLRVHWLGKVGALHEAARAPIDPPLRAALDRLVALAGPE